MKVAFLDRDGTLVYEPPDTHHVTEENLRILPGVIVTLRALKDRNYVLVLVTNQASGPLTIAGRTIAFEKSQKKFEEELAKHGIHFDYVFMCPHTDDDYCDCRKPKTGLVDSFLKNNPFDRKSSFMIGDRKTDGEFARNLHIAFIKLDPNKEFPEIITILGCLNYLTNDLIGG
ncbi:MAG: Histidine biosynthesis bifunctional protein hisB : Histidinol-phosphatase [Candidatus Parcubacteria bacterium]|jgi:imidazoleglycerol-phosphate dehydratase/histidinol-phosphatase